ncbi:MULTISPECIES: 3-oxoacyl-ACP reductase FabG [Halomonadaceae]|uniref:3-oxoacyl-[acyl-carrier-protein] reductase n=1 Tax=Vreelandella halophila TaxID=86177 RepID=A0A9X4YCW2_9GAMM|nr:MULTISPECIES: 3-oxoacyl-ACP reductase FabG [Halomonas]MYL26928.1 3-oxoacyl-ACP reductase FabG [Halomonas utahensis]MYL74189.1 3-oxoacyl-ACP reductase FabG [Halomonas sp. 22501_18_FS]
MLEGQVVLVTGASRGIGSAILERFARAGATVIGTATSESGAAAIAGRINEQGWQGDGVVMNVGDAASVTEGIKAIGQNVGTPTVLVNNAGVTRDGLAMRMKPEDWDEVINTNLSAVYRTSQAVLKGMMKARTGRIINLSSVVARMGNAGQMNYAASKAGIEGMTRSLAREVASRGITVNAIAPGFIETDMTRELDESQRDAMLSAIPAGRLGEAGEVADLAVFLASEGAAYINGETIHVNGGMYMN